LKEDIERMTAHLNSAIVPDDNRLIVKLLHDIGVTRPEDYTLEEIAGRLGLKSKQLVASRRDLTLKKLRGCMERGEPPGPQVVEGNKDVYVFEHFEVGPNDRRFARLMKLPYEELVQRAQRRGR